MDTFLNCPFLTVVYWLVPGTLFKASLPHVEQTGRGSSGESKNRRLEK